MFLLNFTRFTTQFEHQETDPNINILNMETDQEIKMKMDPCGSVSATLIKTPKLLKFVEKFQTKSCD